MGKPLFLVCFYLILSCFCFAESGKNIQDEMEFRLILPRNAEHLDMLRNLDADSRRDIPLNRCMLQTKFDVQASRSWSKQFEVTVNVKSYIQEMELYETWNDVTGESNGYSERTRDVEKSTVKKIKKLILKSSSNRNYEAIFENGNSLQLYCPYTPETGAFKQQVLIYTEELVWDKMPWKASYFLSRFYEFDEPGYQYGILCLFVYCKPPLITPIQPPIRTLDQTQNLSPYFTRTHLLAMIGVRRKMDKPENDREPTNPILEKGSPHTMTIEKINLFNNFDD